MISHRISPEFVRRIKLSQWSFMPMSQSRQRAPTLLINRLRIGDAPIRWVATKNILEEALEPVRDRMKLALEWAYALARTGRYADYREIVGAVAAEGFPEAGEWLGRPSVRESLTTICNTSHVRKAK
jgi:hypothetical protein